MIKSRIINSSYESVDTQGLVISFFSDLRPSFTESIDIKDPFYKFYKTIQPMLTHGDFRGNYGEADWAYTNDDYGPKRIFLLGLGSREDFSLVKLAELSGLLAKVIRKFQLKEFSTVIHAKTLGIPAQKLTEAIILGTKLGLYQFSHNLTLKEKKLFDIERINIIEPDQAVAGLAENGMKRADIIADGVYTARDIINLPSNIVTPRYIAEKARKMTSIKGVECTVYNDKQILDMKMKGLYSVGRASVNKPRLVDIRYTGAGQEKPVVLIGKGLTFDSGGISLKDSQGMYRMKDDMAGAAVVLYAIMTAARLGLKINLIGVLPLCENMISSTSLKPGDVIKAMNGINVEVIDTDAEGRLVLMDALCYGEKLDPDIMVDVATLTGACTIALGRHAIGAVTNSRELVDFFIQAGENINERIWQLPLWEIYKRQLESPVADIKNHGGREAGAITAGAFLSYFVKETPWIHFDIAGVTWLDEETALSPKGASGHGVRLFLEFFENLISRGNTLFKIGGRR